MHPLQNRGTKEQRHDSRRQTDSNSNLALQCHPLGTDHHEMVSNCVRGFGSQCRAPAAPWDFATGTDQVWSDMDSGGPRLQIGLGTQPRPDANPNSSQAAQPPACNPWSRTRTRTVGCTRQSFIIAKPSSSSLEPTDAGMRSRYAPDAPGPLLMPATQQLARSLENTLQLRNSPVVIRGVHRQELVHHSLHR